MQANELQYTIKELPQSVAKTGWIMIVVGVLFGLLGWYFDHTRAAYSYLLAYMFLVSIGLGTLFIIALEYIAGAEWSTPIRRVIELLAWIIPFLLVLVIPLLLSMHTLFHWTHTEAMADKILHDKSPYLNPTFFIIRAVFFVLIWIAFYYFISRNSLKQDKTKDQLLTKKNLILSAIFIPFFAITLTFTSIDWMMSLEPHWFSTIFGVYYFAGIMVGSLAVITYAVVVLMEKGYLHKKMTPDHLYSLGALMFTFINFWGYIAFSQYLLIWYADLPEETFWFLHRWENGWMIVSLLLIVTHFLVPYALLLSQPAKMDPKKLKFAAVWIICAHLLDLYWLILPNLAKEGHGSVFSWIDLTFPVAAVGMIIVVFAYKAKNKNLIPIGDPKLERGLNFHL